MMLWRVADSEMTLCATVHLLGPGDFVFSPALRQAYQSSRRIVFESDGNTDQLPSGVRLRVFPELHAEVCAIGQPLGLEVSNLGNMPLWRVMFVLVVALARRRGLCPEFGVDAHLKSAAQRDGKRITYLEIAPAPIACFANGDSAEQHARFTRFLSRLPSCEAEICGVVQAWHDANIVELERLYWMKMQLDPDVGRCLVERRNRAWMPNIVSMLRDQAPTLVCAGALHFVTDIGLPSLLAQHGYAAIMER